MVWRYVQGEPHYLAKNYLYQNHVQLQVLHMILMNNDAFMIPCKTRPSNHSYFESDLIKVPFCHQHEQQYHQMKNDKF